jgi:hypothetical protein
MILNVPPNRKGLIAPEDSAALMDFRKVRETAFKTNLFKNATAKNNKNEIDISVGTPVTINSIQLQEQIKNLEELLVSAGDAQSTNNIPDTLSQGGFLYSDRTGFPGAVAYPSIQNKLLSKNRKAIAVIQEDGNFAVFTGDYDTNGNLLEGSTSTNVWGVGHHHGPGAAFAWIYADPTQGQLEVGRLQPQWTVNWGSGRQKVSNAARLVLDDNGILMLYDGPAVIWTSFGK